MTTFPCSLRDGEEAEVVTQQKFPGHDTTLHKRHRNVERTLGAATELHFPEGKRLAAKGTDIYPRQILGVYYVIMTMLFE